MPDNINGKDADNKINEHLNTHVRFSEYALTACGILGGITFTALVLIMQQENMFTLPIDIGIIKENYSQILIGGMAGVSAAFMLCTLGLVRPAAGLGLYSNEKLKDMVSEPRRKAYTHATIYLYGIGCYGLMGMLPLLVLPFSYLAALIILVIEITTIIILTYYGEKPLHV